MNGNLGYEVSGGCILCAGIRFSSRESLREFMQMCHLRYFIVTGSLSFEIITESLTKKGSTSQQSEAAYNV